MSSRERAGAATRLTRMRGITRWADRRACLPDAPCPPVRCQETTPGEVALLAGDGSGGCAQDHN